MHHASSLKQAMWLEIGFIQRVFQQKLVLRHFLNSTSMAHNMVESEDICLQPCTSWALNVLPWYYSFSFKQDTGKNKLRLKPKGISCYTGSCQPLLQTFILFNSGPNGCHTVNINWFHNPCFCCHLVANYLVLKKEKEGEGTDFFGFLHLRS